MTKHILLAIALAATTGAAAQQRTDSGISAGFFDSSEGSVINFSRFHLPPLAVLFENAKQTPTILSLAKAQEIAKAEVAKQKRHIFSYVTGHASYSYGKTDMWGNNSSTYNQMIYQFQGTEQHYYNVGVNLAVPLEDILDLGASVKRKRLLVEQAQIAKDQAYDQLKLQIATLYITITNDLVALKTASENAAIYQGAGNLNQEDFHQGNMEIQDYAWTKLREDDAVTKYQNLQTKITTEILTLEIITHTPIITNTTTEITLDSTEQKSARQQAKENRAVEKQVKKDAEAEQKRYDQMEREEKKAAKEETKTKNKAGKADKK